MIYDLRKFSAPEAEIIELPDIDTLVISSGDVPYDPNDSSDPE